jgi:hypothetical protein
MSSKLVNIPYINVNSTKIILSILLIFIALSENFLKQGLSCSVQRLLANNMWVKQLSIFFMIYFTIVITNDDDNIPPLSFLRETLFIFVIFMVFQKTIPWATLSLFILFICIFIFNKHLKYLEKQQENSPYNHDLHIQIKFFRDASNFMSWSLIPLLLIGHGLYLRKQYNDHNQTFDFVKFYIGVRKCRNVMN